MYLLDDLLSSFFGYVTSQVQPTDYTSDRGTSNTTNNEPLFTYRNNHLRCNPGGGTYVCVVGGGKPRCSCIGGSLYPGGVGNNCEIH